MTVTSPQKYSQRLGGPEPWLQHCA